MINGNTLLFKYFYSGVVIKSSISRKFE